MPARVFAKAVAKAAGRAAVKAMGKAKAKARGKALGKAKAKARGKAKAKALGKAKAKARGQAKAKAVARAVAAAAAGEDLNVYVVSAATSVPAGLVVTTTTTTVSQMMAQIQEAEGIPLDQQRLVVEDRRHISGYRLTVGAPPVSIPVETPAGTLWVEARGVLDWARLREEIFDSTGIPPHVQVLRSMASGAVVVTMAAAHAGSAGSAGPAP
jgi:hypothetical protein